jgi:hypothetical protein
MGNSETRAKRGKALTDADVTELSNLSGFTPQQVREWHSGFLVCSHISSSPDVTRAFTLVRLFDLFD